MPPRPPARSSALPARAPRGTLDVAGVLRAGAWASCEELPDAVLRALASTALNTRRSRRANYRVWKSWWLASGRGVLPYPAAPVDVAEFLQDHAPPLRVRRGGEFEVLASATSASGAPVKSLMTLTSYLATLAFLHRAGGLTDPTKDPEVQAVWRVLRRGLARPRQKSALSWQIIEQALAHLPDSLIGKRDRALLVVGYACMARRSELVALDVEHFEKDSDGGATVSLRRIKTNADWTGYLPPRVFGIVEAWLEAAGISSGPVFRRLDFVGQRKRARAAGARLTPLSVTHIYKRVARWLAIPGLDPANISSHSARIGAANDLIEDGAPDAAIMRDAGWSTPRMVAVYGRGAKAKRGAMARRLARVGA